MTIQYIVWTQKQKVLNVAGSIAHTCMSEVVVKAELAVRVVLVTALVHMTYVGLSQVQLQA